jgi:single-stranded-DNA-specific exonuclease
MPTLASDKSIWEVRRASDPELVHRLAGALGVDRRIATLLVQRGITTFEEAHRFFRPELLDLHDPFLMKDMEKAVYRILSALEQGEGIMVYGDYDVDGTTAVALMMSYLLRVAEQGKLSFYLPDRYTEGYGVSFQGMDEAASRGCKLIISLDCGIRSNDKVDYARSLGMDFIICDHHTPGDVLPDALAVLDPKRSDCPYPYKELSGCGIGFKLIQALQSRLELDDVDVFESLDLVATSIAADIVPITGENRVLAFYGLKRINQQARPGLTALLRSTKELSGEAAPGREISITDLVFTAAPRINAAGRIDHGNLAVQLLLSHNLQSALEAVQEVNAHNVTRRSLDQQITAEALAMVNSHPNYSDARATVLFQPHWHKGVVGIVASRVIEHVYRPTIILTESQGKITGSARSVRDFDILEAISACADLLEQFGGHKFAAGLTLKPENLEAFCIRFEEEVAARISESQRVPVLEVDLELEPEDINPKFYRILKQFAPFGPGNMAPQFLCRNLNDSGNARIVGGKHLKLRLGKPEQPWFDAIAFGQAHNFEPISQGIPVDAVFSLEENYWNGKVSLQWNIKELRF